MLNVKRKKNKLNWLYCCFNQIGKKCDAVYTSNFLTIFAKILGDFMYLRAIFCTFQISVDFYFVPVGGRGGAGEGEGARERGIECILYGYT